MTTNRVADSEVRHVRVGRLGPLDHTRNILGNPVRHPDVFIVLVSLQSGLANSAVVIGDNAVALFCHGLSETVVETLRHTGTGVNGDDAVGNVLWVLLRAEHGSAQQDAVISRDNDVLPRARLRQLRALRGKTANSSGSG